ncbi:glutamic acid-rich protein-like [Galleria mellonella]|uniref:Glutamic acid-rich protein-like n=1 Tax=Galleria mellonella TaxID=7137 RepID=A0A6J1WTT7_GALME|nr:glutamic acid-rich protein-like [Galleria mellonella]XP_026755941.2 glutamic acid-rich protein-like [Galleria mellonella]XP_026755947.2 glutamic acid-rich protein-like [Galleria mellonella]
MNHHYENTADECIVICNICNVKVPNTINNRDEHSYGVRHETEYDNLLLINKMKMINDTLYCHVCNLTMYNTDDLNHINDVNHRYEIEKLKIHPHMEKKNGNKLECRVCEVVISSKDHCVSEHVEGNNHTINYSNLLEDNMIKNIGKRVFCELCRRFVKAVKVIDHVLMDEDHIDRYICSLKQNPEPLHYHMCYSSDPKIVICKVCDKSITCTVINNHISSMIHLQKFKTTLAFNKMRKTRSKKKYYCDICHVYVPNKNELEHINGKNHAESIKVMIMKRMVNDLSENNIYSSDDEYDEEDGTEYSWDDDEEDSTEYTRDDDDEEDDTEYTRDDDDEEDDTEYSWDDDEEDDTEYRDDYRYDNNYNY